MEHDWKPSGDHRPCSWRCGRCGVGPMLMSVDIPREEVEPDGRLVLHLGGRPSSFEIISCDEAVVERIMGA